MDSTPTLVDQWCKAAETHYLSVDCHSSTEWLYPTRAPFGMPDARYRNVAILRQEALDTAREMGADYLFVSQKWRERGAVCSSKLAPQGQSRVAMAAPLLAPLSKKSNVSSLDMRIPQTVKFNSTLSRSELHWHST